MATTSKSEVSDTSNGIFKPEVVSSSSTWPRDSKGASQTTDLVPQNRTGLLIPHYEAAAERRPPNFSYQDDPATLNDPIEIINRGSSSMSDGVSESNQGLPRALDVASLPEVGGNGLWYNFFLCRSCACRTI